jgi:hypothetical protein
MNKRFFLIIASTVVVSFAGIYGLKSFPPAFRPGEEENFFIAPIAKQCGVSWVAGRGSVMKEDFLPVAKNHVDWIVQIPFGWQNSHESPSIRYFTEGRVLWGETDSGIETTTEAAKEFGIKTLLKPHIWLRNARDGKWRTDIAMKNEEDWKKWFSDYESFILHYARLAERIGIEALCIGTELHGTVAERDGDWRKLIAKIRKVYGGKLTYAANWYKEFKEVQFWDALDFIGVQAYFPLANKEKPTVQELVSGWKPHFEAVKAVAMRFEKPVVFTEIGYRSMPDGAIEPWKWIRRRERFSDGADLQTQANCYEAFFQVFWEQEWFGGSHFWKWYPNHKRAGGERNQDFTPQNKPAEDVMAKWYGRNNHGTEGE